MSNFFGANDIESTVDLMEERIDYRLTAYSDAGGLGPDQVRNLNFAEFSMYGCIDQIMDSVYPSEDNMKFLNAKVPQDNSPRAIDFVSDAFNTVVQTFNQACHTNVIPIDDPYLSTITAVKAYESPFQKYADYIDDLMGEYLRDYIVGRGKRKEIINVSQYINNLYIFVKNRKKLTPLTFTSWQRSRFSSIFTSGLAIDIAGLATDEDRPKEQLFLNNPIFPFFLNVCKANGFLIPHNTPSILVADIMSPTLLQYTKPYGINSTTRLFEDRFSKTYKRDIGLLKDLIFRYYNDFAGSFQVQKNVDCNCQNKTISSLFDRLQMSRGYFDSLFTHKQWLQMYLNFRNAEEQQPFSDKKIRNMNLKIKNINFDVDNMLDIRYINKEYRLNYRKRYGGLNEAKKRMNIRKSDIKPPTVAGQTNRITTNIDPSTQEPNNVLRNGPERWEEYAEELL